MIETYQFTDNELKDLTNRYEVIKEVKYYLFQKFYPQIMKLKRSEIGKLVISCVPISDPHFVELKGQILNKSNYPDLYNVLFPLLESLTSHSIDRENLKKHYGTIPLNSSNKIELPSGDFYVPDMYNRALKSSFDSDSKGKSNDWNINPNYLHNFNLEDQSSLLKNIRDSKDYTTIDNPNTFNYTKKGKDVYINKSTSTYNLLPSDKSINDISFNTDSKVYFNSHKIYFYIRASFPSSSFGLEGLGLDPNVKNTPAFYFNKHLPSYRYGDGDVNYSTVSIDNNRLKLHMTENSNYNYFPSYGYFTLPSWFNTPNDLIYINYDNALVSNFSNIQIYYSNPFRIFWIPSLKRIGFHAENGNNTSAGLGSVIHVICETEAESRSLANPRTIKY